MWVKTAHSRYHIIAYITEFSSPTPVSQSSNIIKPLFPHLPYVRYLTLRVFVVHPYLQSSPRLFRTFMRYLSGIKLERTSGIVYVLFVQVPLMSPYSTYAP